MKLPPPFETVRAPGARAFARPSAVRWVRTTLESGATLHEAALASARTAPLQGRGPVPVVPVDGERWAVRHYFRGGAVASTLDDRYLRLGEPRPMAEALRSLEAARRGIPTPRIVAGATYTSGIFYRADFVTEYVPESRDLGAVLFPGPESPPSAWADPWVRDEALRAAGRLVAIAAGAGLYHTDLNARNILLARRGMTLLPLMLDLDRCRMDVAGPSRVEEAMLLRLERSLAKLAAAAGETPGGGDLELLQEGLRS